MDFDIDDMILTSNKFAKKLNGLAKLSEQAAGNKLGVYNEETYISWWYLQGVQRTIYGESIDKLLDFLKITFDDYFIFNIMIRRAIQSINDELLLLVRSENDKLINKWKDGIDYLKKEYSSNELIQKKLDSFIIHLL
jgi:hypothetical protein